MDITYSIRAEALLARLKGTQDRLQASMRQAVERLSIRVQSDVKENKLTGQALHVRTGTLRRSINRRVEQDERSITATIGTNVIYGRIHEYGGRTSPHVIEAKNASVLAFQGAGGEMVFRRRVMHPGSEMPERSFLRSTLNEFRGEIETTLREAALRAVQP